MELKIDEQTAKKIFPDAPEWFKNQLVEKFGEKLFIPKSWEAITSYELAVAARPVDEEDKIYPTDAPHIVVFKELSHITKVINGKWVRDHENPDQKRWEQIFLSSGSGFDFSDSYYRYDLRDSYVGSRYAFETEEQSDFLGRTFVSKFKLLITNKK
jgi:hypothetical protein